MSSELMKNSAPDKPHDKGMDDFKIELKKIGNLEENTQQPPDGPYDIVCSAP